MRRLRSIGHWFEERTGLGAMLAVPMGHRVPRSTASWAYVFGSATLILFVMQIATGICLALVYVPSPDQAYESLEYLNHTAPLGWYLRAVHFWGSNAMVLVMTLHMIQVFLWGAHKYPRELTWIAGVLLFLCTLGMAFTGQVLRWDQDAYWGLGIGIALVLLLSLAFGYVHLSREYRTAGAVDPQLGLKTVLHYFFSVSYLLALTGASMLVGDLMFPESEYGSDTQRIGAALLAVGLGFALLHFLLLFQATNDRLLPTAGRFFTGWRLALHGFVVIVAAAILNDLVGWIIFAFVLAMLAGGIRHRTQSFQALAARAQATLLILSAIALVVPAVFHHVARATREVENDLSLEISLVLLAIYAAHLVFSLITHRSFFRGLPSSTETGDAAAHAPWSRTRSLAVLAVSTAFIAWMSEILVGSVEQAAHSWGMSQVFVGVIVVAVIGNAAEHSSAIVMAWKNRMDLSLSIAVGSSIQVALFVAPLLVLLSHAMGPAPMDLVFTPAEVLAVVVTAVIAAQIASDGESNWLEGAMLLAVYVILGLAFYFLPDAAAH